MNKDMQQSVKVWGWQYSPYSTDPMEYDDVVHHVVWTSVLGTLVSNYKVGQVTPQIAESWRVNNNFTEWSFRIKAHCFFENGDSITPEIVANSFKRIALQQLKRKSLSGITEELLDIKNLKNMDSQIAGIFFNENEFKLKFIKPQKDLLSKIGFGIYAITHPSQYNKEGDWKDNRKVISSGPYKMTSWSDNALNLKLNDRQTSCYSMPPKFLKEIQIIFGTSNIDINKQSIVSGSSESLMIDDSFEFLGPADSDIMYLRVYNKIGDTEINHILRDVIIKEFSLLTNIRFLMNRSFLPLTIKGVQQGTSQEINEQRISLLKGLHLRVPLYKTSQKSEKNMNMLSYTDAFNEVMSILKKKYGVQIVRSNFEVSSFNDIQKRSSLYDMEMLLTGILVENPYEDIQFMFQSKEGIQLPDTDGSITTLLRDVETNLPKINEKLWDQARIIPLTHYSSGLWFKKNQFDVKDLNHTLPPTNFQFIGFK